MTEYVELTREEVVPVETGLLDKHGKKRSSATKSVPFRPGRSCGSSASAWCAPVAGSLGCAKAGCTG
ncbi:hypothetical protein ACFSTD_09830 [Novosphingobium colocasiae]